MKKLGSLLIISAMVCFSCGNAGNTANEVKIKTTPEVDSVSYCIGIMYSNFTYNNFRLQQLNFQEFEIGMNSFINKSDLRIHKDSCRLVIDKFVNQFEDTTITQANANYDNLDDISNALGIDIANTIISQFKIQFNSTEILKAFKTTYEGTEPYLSLNDAGIYFEHFINKRQKEDYEKQQADNRKSMKEIVDGKVTLKSGLQIEVLSEGTGVSPTLQDQVTVHYTGKLEDGTVFDSSVDRGESATFVLTQVIPAWTEALQLMQVGSKWNLIIPSDLAYGEQGVPQAGIGPNSILYFEVELLKIN